MNLIIQEEKSERKIEPGDILSRKTQKGADLLVVKIDEKDIFNKPLYNLVSITSGETTFLYVDGKLKEKLTLHDIIQTINKTDDWTHYSKHDYQLELYKAGE